MPAPTAPSPQPMPSFTWPPPRASAEFVVPKKWLPTGNQVRLADVAASLEQALGAAKYPRWSYLSVPNGFALVSQMEQIRKDGSPSPDAARWSTQMPPASSMNVVEFIKALANAQPGFYRVIVFVATDQPWKRSGTASPTGKQAEEWLSTGVSALPPDLGQRPYGDGHRTTTLIYEFRKASANKAAVLVNTSPTPARRHLDKAGIAEALTR